MHATHKSKPSTYTFSILYIEFISVHQLHRPFKISLIWFGEIFNLTAIIVPSTTNVYHISPPTSAGTHKSLPLISYGLGCLPAEAFHYCQLKLRNEMLRFA